MKNYVGEIKNLVQKYPEPIVEIKQDGSPVTPLDIELSEYFEKKAKQEFSDHTFYSEENFSRWSFPMFIVDPIDGTREYISKIDEWAISIGVIEDENWNGQGWIYNPVRDCIYNSESLKKSVVKSVYRGEVSRSEWKKGFFTNHKSEKFKLYPMGSIAHKLGRLSSGECDFVLSLTPKNIWDVAGGTVLCKSAGFKFYSQGKEVTKVQAQYRPPLLWCHESIALEIMVLYP